MFFWILKKNVKKRTGRPNQRAVSQATYSLKFYHNSQLWC